MTFGLYLIGFVLVIAGLAWGAFQMGIAPVWIVIGSIILLGFGILSGAARTRQKDPAE